METSAHDGRADFFGGHYQKSGESSFRLFAERFLLGNLRRLGGAVRRVGDDGGLRRGVRAERQKIRSGTCPLSGVRESIESS